ncbi:MAG: DUF4435 domain-containing protein [Cyanobacteria bacterium J06621_12]
MLNNIRRKSRDDPSFLRVHIEREVKSKGLSLITTVLENKKEVIETWKLFGTRFPNNPRLCFFVDKDHDDFLGKVEGTNTKDNLFVTEYYSIENYLATTEVIKAVLNDLWGIDSLETIKAACTDFETFQKAYRNAFLPLMAWWLAARKYALNKKVNKNNLSFSILKVDSDLRPTLNWNPDINQHLAKQCNVSVPLSEGCFSRDRILARLHSGYIFKLILIEEFKNIF